MATVKIYLEQSETLEEAQEILLKSLTHHETGGVHREDFNQPAARDVVSVMMKEHGEMLERMLREIFTLINEDGG